MGIISIPGSPEDYYVALTKQDGTVYYSGVRAKIRDIVKLHNTEIKRVIAIGENPHTASLDFIDVINDFISASPIEAQAAFYEVFNQEMNAATSKTVDDTNKILAETAQKEASAQSVGAWIGAGVIFVLMLLFLFSK
ncbi:hypothetical protein AB6869_23815 [Rahnella rivi]|uniref:hypothetical protein n=1 Tax=Rahnella rivi TaxID=2816249 RepID=UPI0039BDF24F